VGGGKTRDLAQVRVKIFTPSQTYTPGYHFPFSPHFLLFRILVDSMNKDRNDSWFHALVKAKLF
jgi:hypothetical protein